MRPARYRAAAVLIPCLLLFAQQGVSASLTATAAVPGDAGRLHDRLLTLDTHLDTPLHFPREGWSFGERHALADDLAQVDIPRMADGALDGGFFVIYTPQGPLTKEGYAEALAFARTRSDVIDATIAGFPQRIEPALTAADAERLAKARKLVAFKSLENSYPLGENVE